MKLILDQGLPRSTAALLRDSGVDAVHTGELGLATAEDHEILERTPHEQSVLDAQIAATDRQMALCARPAIDRLVYELYGLTEEEIRIVEGG